MASGKSLYWRITTVFSPNHCVVPRHPLYLHKVTFARPQAFTVCAAATATINNYSLKGELHYFSLWYSDEPFTIQVRWVVFHGALQRSLISF